VQPAERSGVERLESVHRARVGAARAGHPRGAVLASSSFVPQAGSRSSSDL
jgi:hypothetical protein